MRRLRAAPHFETVSTLIYCRGFELLDDIADYSIPTCLLSLPSFLQCLASCRATGKFDYLFINHADPPLEPEGHNVGTPARLRRTTFIFLWKQVSDAQENTFEAQVMGLCNNNCTAWYAYVWDNDSAQDFRPSPDIADVGVRQIPFCARRKHRSTDCILSRSLLPT